MGSIANGPYLGIMTHETEGQPPIGEKSFCARLCRLSRSLGLSVFVFTPQSADPETQTVTGYVWIPGNEVWTEHQYPLPDLIYDRSFPAGGEAFRRHRMAVKALDRLKPIPRLGRGLGSKWEMHRLLSRDPGLAPHLPDTRRLVRPEAVAERLETMSRLFLKPSSGSQGRGTAAVERLAPGRYRITARDGANRPIEQLISGTPGLTEWVRRFAAGRAYLVQPYLELQSPEGFAWDVRSLVQKNGSGSWELTGMAVREGGSGSVTSNLHGGGHAREVRPFLEQRFGKERAQTILGRLDFLSGRIPAALEAGFGRLAELGLDFGVDRNGEVWIIEANSKPGRSVFRELALDHESLLAARNPLAYARYLLKFPPPAAAGDRAVRSSVPGSRPHLREDLGVFAAKPLGGTPT